MKGLFCIIFTLFLVSAVWAADTCSVLATLTKRDNGGWVDQGVSYQIYDMRITNTGSCPFSKAFVAIALTSGNISEAWNYDIKTHLVSNFDTLNPGSSFPSAGIVVAGGGVPSIASASADCGTCGAAPTTPPTSTPTSTPTSPPTSTPTSTPTGSPTNPPIDTNCELSVSQTRRTGEGSSWVTGTSSFQIYDLVFTNTGSETLTFAQLSEGLSVGYPSAWWSMVKACCDQIRSAISYNVTIPEGGLEVGVSISAGFILEYPTTEELQDPLFDNPIVQTEFFDWVVCDQD